MAVFLVFRLMDTPIGLKLYQVSSPRTSSFGEKLITGKGEKYQRQQQALYRATKEGVSLGVPS